MELTIPPLVGVSLAFALYPANNSTGSWELMFLTTKTRVKRSQWKAMVTTELIIDVMNHFDDQVQVELPPEAQQPPALEPVQAPVETPATEVVETPSTEPIEATTEEVPDLVDPGPDSDSKEEDEDDELPVEEEKPDGGIASRTRQKSGTQARPPSRYSMAIKVQNKNETPERRKAIERADKDEIELLFVDLQGLKPVCYDEIKNAGAQVYNSHMFGVKKFLADGTHDKFKSRLVFDGRDRDPELFPDRSSPTVALHSLMACLALATAKGINEVGKIDVKGAFIQTEMKGPPLYIRCDKEFTKLIVKQLPGIKKYVTPDGKLFCCLLKPSTAAYRQVNCGTKS